MGRHALRSRCTAPRRPTIVALLRSAGAAEASGGQASVARVGQRQATGHIDAAEERARPQVRCVAVLMPCFGSLSAGGPDADSLDHMRKSKPENRMRRRMPRDCLACRCLCCGKFTAS